MVDVSDIVNLGGVMVPTIDRTTGRMFPGRLPQALQADLGFDYLSLDGAVEVALHYEGAVFIAGNFQTVNGLPRNCVAKLDAKTGEVLSWDAALGGFAGFNDGTNISALFADNGRIYLALRGAGDVTATVADGTTRTGLVVVSTEDGRVTEAPDLAISGGPVLSFHKVGRQLYIGGYFTSVLSAPQGGGVQIDMDLWTAGTFNPTLLNAGSGIAGIYGWADIPASGDLLICGDWATVGGSAWGGVARVNSFSGALIGSYNNAIADPTNNAPYVYAMYASPTFLYVFGSFTVVYIDFSHPSTTLLNGVARLHLTSGAADNRWLPAMEVGDFVDLATFRRGAVYMSGLFLSVSQAPGLNFAQLALDDNFIDADPLPLSIPAPFVDGFGVPNPTLSVYSMGSDRNAFYVPTANFGDDTDPRTYWLRKVDISTFTQLADNAPTA